MTHPSSLDLEAFAVGEPLPAHLASHVEDCSACGSFLAQVRTTLGSGPSAQEADDAVARALARVTADAEPHAARIESVASGASGASGAPRERANDLVAARRPAQDPKRRLWLVTSSMIAPLAAAAAILLATRSPAPAPAASADPNDPRAPTTYKIQMATVPPGLAPSLSGANGAAEPDTQFKGGMQVAVVRDRAGSQARFSSTVRVKPGDRLRVEVALDHEQAILGAVLADDGSYLELMPQGVRGPGTHFSERSAKIDAAGARGTIIIGSPEAVARARETRNLEGVTTLRVELESP
jgi:hypothetical protein